MPCSRLLLPHSALRECLHVTAPSALRGSLHATSPSALRGYLCASSQLQMSQWRHGCRLLMSPSSSPGEPPLGGSRSQWRGGTRDERWTIAGGRGHRDGLARVGDRCLASLGSECEGGASSRGTVDTTTANALLLSVVSCGQSYGCTQHSGPLLLV